MKFKNNNKIPEISIVGMYVREILRRKSIV